MSRINKLARLAAIWSPSGSWEVQTVGSPRGAGLRGGTTIFGNHPPVAVGGITMGGGEIP